MSFLRQFWPGSRRPFNFGQLNLALSEDNTVWNKYADYQTAVRNALAKLYNSVDGASAFNMLVNFRAARIAGGNAKVIIENSDATRKWYEDEFNANNYFETLISQIAILTEAQGQSLNRIFWKDKKERVFVQPMPLFRPQSDDLEILDDSEQNYYFDTEVNEFKETLTKSFPPDQPLVFINYFPLEQVVLNNIVVTPAVVHPLLPSCEAMDSVNLKIRKVNQLYAKPSLSISFKTKKAKDDFEAWISQKIQEGKNTFELGQMFSLYEEAKAEFIQPDNAGVESLLLEKKTHAKEISSVGSVPLHKMGFPEEMGSGRATAQVSEDVALIEYQRREIERGLVWILQKAARLTNEKRKSALLNPDAIRAVRLPLLVPELTAAKIERLQLDHENGRVSLRTYLENHPDVKDVEEEMQRIAEEKATLMVKIQERLQNASRGDQDV